MELYNGDLEFLSEAVKVFEENPTTVTWIKKDESLIALRWGLANDCIKVYRLNGEVAFINNCVTPVKLKTIVQQENVSRSQSFLKEQ